MNIAEFLEARIAEDEKVARDASPGPWSFSDIASIGGGTIYDATVAIANVEWDTEHVDSHIRRTRPVRQADATGEHIARHDPASVLAECAAKRALISAGENLEARRLDENLWSMDAPDEIIIRILAAVYKDHPDYQQEWALNG